MYDPASLRPYSLPRLLLAILALLGLTGCGIQFTDSFEGTELFKGIQLDGDRVAGSELTVRLTLNPSYTVPVEIDCFYEDDEKLTSDQQDLPFHERATKVGSKTLEPAQGVQPKDDVDRIEISFSFRVAEPGDYFIACLTPVAPENGMGASFKVAATN